MKALSSPFRTILALSLLLCALSVPATPAKDRDYAKRSVEQLIDDLAQIDAESPGVNGAGIYDGFIADDTPGAFRMGVLGVAPPGVPPQMSELVRRGPLALPALVEHIDDKRPTKLEVGNDESRNSTHQVGVDSFMFMYFSDEYDPRVRHSARSRRNPMEKDFQGRYTVKVGDVCYVLIGQIVNRRLLAVRYQPSGGLIVNSPVEAPLLAERIREDWGHANAQDLKASLLADIRAATSHKRDPELGDPTDELRSALKRLKLYFPTAYAALSTDLKKKY